MIERFKHRLKRKEGKGFTEFTLKVCKKFGKECMECKPLACPDYEPR